MMNTFSKDFIWQELIGRLWHTTHPDHFQRILQRGAIIPEPDIPESARWKTERPLPVHLAFEQKRSFVGHCHWNKSFR
jgi:hypothetical protein